MGVRDKTLVLRHWLCVALLRLVETLKRELQVMFVPIEHMAMNYTNTIVASSQFSLAAFPAPVLPLATRLLPPASLPGCAAASASFHVALPVAFRASAGRRLLLRGGAVSRVLLNPVSMSASASVLGM